MSLQILLRSSVLSKSTARMSSLRLMSSSFDSGKAGSIREAGGAFGEMEKAREEQYFRKLQAEQIKKLHDHLEEEVRHLKTSIKSHEDAIERAKSKLKELKHE